MEMVEEERNQHAIPPKRIRFQEIVEKLGEEVDRISALPDCLLYEILSRLPSTTHAIRTGTLSKRWEHLWTLVHTLDFTDSDDPLTQCPQNPNLSSDFFSFVDKTLTQCRQLKLKKFNVITSYDVRFESQVNNWIRYAISCNVEELDLYICCEEEAEFVLDQFIFTSLCFTDLRLASCMMNPTGAISWTNLRSLCISYVKLDEDLIENILSGSPILETLVLHDCYGYRRLDISSKSVKNFEFSGYSNPEDVYGDLDDIIEINAPNIFSLTIRDFLMLWKILLVNVSSLVEANLDFRRLWRSDTTVEEAEQDMLEGFIQSLRHVKQLNIGSSCSRARSRLEAKGFGFPLNMKYTDVTYD